HQPKVALDLLQVVAVARGQQGAADDLDAEALGVRGPEVQRTPTIRVEVALAVPEFAGGAEHPGGGIGRPGPRRRIDDLDRMAAADELVGDREADDARPEDADHRATASARAAAAPTGSGADQIPPMTAMPCTPIAVTRDTRSTVMPPIARTGSAFNPASVPTPSGSGSPS